MASRYFIAPGATANWNDTGNWSASSGGATGASVPGSSDDVFFDAASFSAGCTITVDADASCLAMDWTGLDQAVTLSSSVYDVYVYGALTYPASNLTVTFTGTAYWNWKATTSVNITMGATSGRTLNRLYIDGAGGTWTNQDEMNVTGDVFIPNGTWATNDQTVTISGIIQASSGVLTLGSSSFTCEAFKPQCTVNTGTSTITITGLSTYSIDGNYAFYDVVLNRSGVQYINGSSTFRNLTKTHPSGTTNNLFGIYGNQTITGVLTITGVNSSNGRQFVYSSVLGTARTLTCNGSTNITNTDFRDITFAGSAIPNFSTGTGGDVETGDCGGNSGATFRAGETRYYHVGTGNYHDAKWYSATNGGGSAKGMPLPQDTAMFDANSFDGTATLTIANSRVGSIDFSGVDDAVTVTLSNAIECYGDLLGSTNNTYSGNYTRTMLGRGSHDLDLVNKSFYALTVNSIGGTYTLGGHLTTSAVIEGSLTLTKGTLDFNDYNVTTNSYNQRVSSLSYLYMGNGTFDCTATTSGYYNFRHTFGTLYAEGSTLKFEGNAYTSFVSDQVFNNIWWNGTHTLWDVVANWSCNNLKVTAGATVRWKAGRNITCNTVTAVGTAIAPITWSSVTAATHTISCPSGTIECDYLTLSYSTATGGATFYAGGNSTDGGNNSGWIFGDAFTSILIWM